MTNEKRIINIEGVIKKLQNQLTHIIENINNSQYVNDNFGDNGEYSYNDLLKIFKYLIDIEPKSFFNKLSDTGKVNCERYFDEIDPNSPENLFAKLKDLDLRGLKKPNGIQSVIKHFNINYTKYMQNSVNNFDKQIKELEEEIEKQKIELNEKSEQQRMELEGKEQTLDGLIEKAKDTMSLGAVVGLGKFFQKRFDDVEATNLKWRRRPQFWWVAASIIFVLIGVVSTIIFIIKNPDNSFSTTLARLSIVTLPMAAAWFCAGQYTKLKNIAEDYAYKITLVSSIVGFSEQLKNDNINDNIYQKYMEKTLDEIHQHPLSKHKRQPGTIGDDEKIFKWLKEKMERNEH